VTVLVLGGTSEARDLAGALTAGGTHVISSLAGRVERPRLPPGEVRVGGFGGPGALRAWLSEHRIAAVVDATHPFAQRISESAATACSASGVPLLRLERPGWKQRDDDDWHWVGDTSEAAAAIPGLGRRVFLTTGRQGLPAFAGLSETWFLIRCIDPPAPPLPPACEVLLDRGPYDLAGELGLIDRHGLDLLVSKDSGGELTGAKLEAARRRGLPVIVIRRPPRPETATATDVAGALAWLAGAA
jgi:precorrin-6A/cobalt-precorrin-6A reductase